MFRAFPPLVYLIKKHINFISSTVECQIMAFLIQNFSGG